MNSPIPIPNSAPEHKWSFAFAGSRAVRLAHHVHCPPCQRELQASDVYLIGEETHLVCSGCHRDVLTIVGESSKDILGDVS
jgi:transposase-like protein